MQSPKLLGINKLSESIENAIRHSKEFFESGGLPHTIQTYQNDSNFFEPKSSSKDFLVDTYWLNPNSGQLQFPSGSGSESYSVMLLHDNTQNQSPISDEPSMLHYPYLLRFFRDSTSAPLSGGISSPRNGESVFSTGRSSFPRSVSFRIIRGASSAQSGSLAVWPSSSQPPQAAQSIPSAQSPPAGSPRRTRPQLSVRREAGC